MDRGLALQCLVHTQNLSRHVTQLTRNFLSRAAGLISAGPRLGLAQAVSARAHTQTETHGTSTARATRAHVTTFSFTTRASSIVVRNHRLTRRHVARHAHLPMRPSLQLLLPPACKSCCRLLLPAASQGPPPPHAAHIHQRFCTVDATICGHHRPLCPGLLRVAHWMTPPWMAQRPRRRRRLQKRLPSPPPRATRPQSWPSDLPN